MGKPKGLMFFRYLFENKEKENATNATAEEEDGEAWWGTAEYSTNHSGGAAQPSNRRNLQDKQYHGSELHEAEGPAGGNPGKGDPVETEADGGNDRGDGDRRDEAEYRGGNAGVPNGKLNSPGH